MISIPPPQFGLETRYVLDANIFMTAWHDHYPIDIYPGFWACLEYFSEEKRLLSVDRIRDEINGPSELVAWLNQHLPGAFVSTKDLEIAKVYSEMQMWVQANTQFLQAARHEFARVADGWLAAYAKANNAVVVTNEVYNENTKKKVPLPNLCKQFCVEYCSTIEMLRGLGVTFGLATR